MLYCLICPLDILLESEEALTVYIAGSLFLSKYLYSDTTLICKCQVSRLFKNWWRLNLVMRDKIAKLLSPPIFPVTYMVLQRLGAEIWQQEVHS